MATRKGKKPITTCQRYLYAISGWSRVFLFYALLATVTSTTGMADQGSEFPLWHLEGGVEMPFPGKPTRLAHPLGGGSEEAFYRFVDAESSISFTATTMTTPNESLFAGTSAMHLNAYLSGTLETVDGRVLEEGELRIDGRPALYVVASMGVVEHLAHSHTLAIFDDGKIHSWAVQDVPAVTGGAGAEIFFEHLDRIRLSANPGSGSDTTGQLRGPDGGEQDNLRLTTLGQVRFPFPGSPEIEPMQIPVGQATLAQYVEPESGRVLMGGYYRDLPPVHDPRATLLRGARQGQAPIDEGFIEIDGVEGRYEFFPNNPPSRGGTYAVVFEAHGSLYQWLLIGDMERNHSELRTLFFDMVERIQVQ